MDKITLYTGKSGYDLFQKGLPFLASKDKQSPFDYKVVAPIECIAEHPLEDDLECCDVIKLIGVTVELDKN
jgi:hypothetical protein